MAEQHGGAKPKTPTNSPQKGGKENDTPVKVSVNFRSGSCSNFICLFCGDEKSYRKDRWKLFENITSKTAACKRIENALQITIDCVFVDRIVCRKCDRQISALPEKAEECRRRLAHILIC